MSVAGPWNTSHLQCVAQRCSVTMLQSPSSADSSSDTYANEQTESQSLQVHTADVHFTSVDMFHAYCAVAVVRHRHADQHCTLRCCSDELTAYQAAGLCRLLLWDVVVSQRRSAEELMYIHQLQTGLTAAASLNCEPLNTNTNQQLPTCHPNDEFGASITGDVSPVADKLSLHSECEPSPTSTGMKPDLVSQRDMTAVDDASVNSASGDLETSSPGLQLCREWQTLPLDIKYTQRPLSEELLQQEADRLRRLCDSVSHHMVIDYC